MSKSFPTITFPLYFLFISSTINAQVIDWKDFDESALNDAVFNKVSNYIASTTFRGDNGQDVKGTVPTKFVEGMKCVCNDKVETFTKVHRKDIKTYQELADKCISNWKSDGVMSLTLWSKWVEVTCKYKKINQKFNDLFFLLFFYRPFYLFGMLKQFLFRLKPLLLAFFQLCILQLCDLMLEILHIGFDFFIALFQLSIFLT